MQIAIFGLTLTSAWGNGHATLWRGLCRELHAQGHHVTFFERDVPYYAGHRDFESVPWCDVVLYDDWPSAAPQASAVLAEADAAIVTSFCPDGPLAARLVLSSPARRIFYDLDAPVTLDRLARGESVPYLPEDGFAGFDLVLSFAGGPTLDDLRLRLGARVALPLYGSVDPAVHHPVPPDPGAGFDLSYIGTYAEDRQHALEALFIEPARRRPDLKFVLAGSQYPAEFPWTGNTFYRSHMPPADHPTFFCSSRLTLNITRGPMAAAGYCPSGRLFEAAACGTAVVTDIWEGIETFFEPGTEILVASGTDDVLEALALPDEQLKAIGEAARKRAITSHSAQVRARQLSQILERTCDASGTREVVA